MRAAHTVGGGGGGWGGGGGGRGGGGEGGRRPSCVDLACSGVPLPTLRLDAVELVPSTLRAGVPTSQSERAAIVVGGGRVEAGRALLPRLQLTLPPALGRLHEWTSSARMTMPPTADRIVVPSLRMRRL